MKRTRTIGLAASAAFVVLLSSALTNADAATSLSKTLTIGLEDDAAIALSTKNGWILAGTTFESSESSTVFADRALGGSDIWVASLDATLAPTWSHRAGTMQNDIFGGAALDQSGNIWLVGSSQSETVTAAPIVMTTPAPATIGPGNTPITVNPDGVSLTSPLVAAPRPLSQLIIQGVRSDGSALLKTTISFGAKFAVLPTGVVSDNTGLWIAGTILTLESKALRGFYLNCDFALQCKAPIYLGKSGTSIRTTALSAGNLLVAGSTTDVWKGKPAIGKVDALAVVVNVKSGAITQTQRSGNSGTRRSWESGAFVNGEAVLAGTVDYGKKMEIVTTTFSKTGAVVSTRRWLGSPPVALAPRVGGAIALAFAVSPSELKAISPPTKGVGLDALSVSLSASKSGSRTLGLTHVSPRVGDQSLLALAANSTGLLTVSGSGPGLLLLDFYPDSGSGAVKR
ncbi:MAG: hypothetical protein F2718_03025 [Actinobacteria bacterium]|uniref:Unannotated protein n=1 Tax=freshwater metagenome TaxID=449393 RepID=A0A6J6VFE6_9ZZZZ|nr:hypothetical protein [Actinomycetota bacterium]MTB13570.1 hypothetical protein [Actinomycetota bacterium]MTB25002.1 hypothetical protein [Actinomycetota bacterium]